MTTIANAQTIVELYGDQAAARAAQAHPAQDQATQQWYAAVAQETAKAHAALPHHTARLQAAQTLVLDGAVALGIEGHATVRSCSDAGVFYEVNGVCACKDAQYNAPDGLCKHRLAVGLVKRATKHLQAPVVVQDAPTRRCPTCFLALEEGEVDCTCAHQPPAPSAPPAAVAAHSTEASFSLTLKGTLDGHDAMLTARGNTWQEFHANVAQLRGLLDAPGGPTTRREAAAPQAAREERCTLHDESMTFHKPTAGGRGWFSHQMDDGTWCKGKRR